MVLEFHCPQCNKKLRTKIPGRSYTCPQCNQPGHAPGGPPAAPAEQPPTRRAAAEAGAVWERRIVVAASLVGALVVVGLVLAVTTNRSRKTPVEVASAPARPATPPASTPVPAPVPVPAPAVARPAAPEGKAITVRSDPPGAAVTADGKPLGTAPLTATLAGRVSLAATLPGYEAKSVEVDVRSHAGDVVLALIPKAAVFTLRVDPPEAEVVVEGGGAKVRGVGAERVVEVPRPTPGLTVTVTGSLAGCEDDRQQLQPRPGERAELALRPKLKPVSVPVDVDPPTAVLTVAGTGARITGEGGRRQLVVDAPKPGTSVEVTAALAGHESVTQKWTAGADAAASLALKLKVATVWKPIPSNGTSQLVIVIDKDGTIATQYPGTLAAIITAGKVTTEFDPPGSLWFMAEGGSAGVRYRGTVLEEGKVYKFDANRKPLPTKDGDYSAWITFEKAASLYRTAAATGEALAELAVGDKVQLLQASKTGSLGRHRVRTTQGVEGWVDGAGWKTTTFQQRVK